MEIDIDSLDCGSSSCRFAKDKSGQRTNGPCRCLAALSKSEVAEIQHGNKKKKEKGG